MILGAALLLLQAVGGQPGAPASPAAVTDPAAVRAGVAVSVDTVTVGTPFVIQLRVRAPVGSEVEFPPGPDTTGVVQPLDPPLLVPGSDSAVVDRTMRYRVAAWDVGAQSVELGSVRVRTGAFTRELSLDPVEVEVVSILPADSLERVPKPARPPVEFPRPWWIPWLLALLAAALIGLLVWWYVRRRRRRPPVAHEMDALAAAGIRFRQIDALALPECGEAGRHVALTQEVLREYLARRVPAASVSLTSRELLVALARQPEVPLERLTILLREGDLIKFAARSVTAPRAHELGRESEAIVGAVDAAMAESAAAAAAAAAEQQPPAERRLGSAA
ncbi:MAG: hypothetical protein ACYC2G_09915 [Gemmatimonadaceae bacterium]